MRWYFVYVLLSEVDKKLYIGFTPDDVFRRQEKHNQGLVESTKGRRPFKLIFFEAYLNRVDALKRERYFKTTKGKATIKCMLKAYFSAGPGVYSEPEHIERSPWVYPEPEPQRVVQGV